MIALILLLGLVLRLIKMNQSLWLDEAISISAAQSLSFKNLILSFSPGDFHPPLFYLILKAWTQAFGFSEIAARIPSVIFAVGSIYFAYLIGRKLYDKKTAIIAAILVSTSPLHIYYSQEARMYMLAAFLASASVYFFISLWDSDRLQLWIGFILSTILLLYSDYLPYLLIFLYLPFLFFLRKKLSVSSLKSFVPATLLIVIFLIPIMIIFPHQFSTGQSVAAASPAWASIVGEASFKNLMITFVKLTIGRISSDNNVTYILLFAPIALFVVLLFSLSLFRISPKRAFLYFWFFAPIIAAFAVAFFIPVFAYFRFIFILPAFYLIWASAINTVNWVLPTRILLTCALSINLISAAIYFLNPKFQRENWRGATSYVIANSNQNTAILFESSSSFAPFDYYNRGQVQTHGGLSNFSADLSRLQKNVPEITAGKNKVFLFQYLSGITDPQGLLFEELTRNNFKNTTTKDFEGVGFVYEFTR